jgi:hypothetical protein
VSNNHYVNNAEFLEALNEHRANVLYARENGLEAPMVSNYIGECFIKISQHLSYKHNFVGYTFKDEMISDGIENCLAVVNNFDPAKSSNPFAYFTQIIYYAFIRRIQKEKRQTLIKGRLIMESPIELFELQEQDEDGQFVNNYIDFIQSNGVYDAVVQKDNERKAAKKAKTDVPTLDDILVETDE